MLLQAGESKNSLSSVTTKSVDVNKARKITELAKKVLDGELLTREEGLWLFELDHATTIYELLYWANRIRAHYKSNNIRLCSIVNIKAGGCPEDCKFCAQSAHYKTASPRYGLIDDSVLLETAAQVQAHNVHALGLVAAWPEIKEGAFLDKVCEKFRLLKQASKIDLHASLGMIKSQKVADTLKTAGVKVYNHNLETSQRFFPQICSTHSYADRLQTIKYLRSAGIAICSGGIIGLGETRADRCELAFSLREIGADIVPINILNPIPGTPLGTTTSPEPLEVLHTIACFRFILPNQEITVAGGRGVNLRDLQSWIFMAGASALMVGNYLTTPNRAIEQDLQMLKDLGLNRV